MFRTSKYIRVMKTDLMRYLSSVYFVNQPLHVSGIFVAHHHEVYVVVTKVFRTDAVKIAKLTIRPISRRHPRSSSLPHVDTGPTVSSMFGTLPGCPFLSECQALCDSARISSMVSNRCPFSFSFIFENRRKSQGAKSGEYGVWCILFFSRNWWVKTEVWDEALSWWSSQVCSRQNLGRRLRTFLRSRRKTSQ